MSPDRPRHPLKADEFAPNDRGWPDLRWRFTSRSQGEVFGLASAECSPASDDDIVLLDRDIAGPAYAAMLVMARRHAYSFSLVWRDDVSYGPQAHALLRSLGPWLCHEHHTHEWRGTTLLQAKAWARWFRATDESLALIARPESLFAWRRPLLPDDMAFYTEDGRGWLGSTAHEGLAWIDVTAIDRYAAGVFLTTHGLDR